MHLPGIRKCLLALVKRILFFPRKEDLIYWAYGSTHNITHAQSQISSNDTPISLDAHDAVMNTLICS